MSKPKGFEKPTGVKDYVPEVVDRLRHVELRVLTCMESWGYRQIITPTLEFYDTVGAASATMDKKLFKLLDQNGRTLVLRSDMTAPIARVISSLLKDAPLPLRLSYHSNVFRAFAEEAGKESEFFQTGVELVGDPTAEADAEVIALSIASLQAAGIHEFKIALGHLGFLNGLFQEMLPDRLDEQHALKTCLLGRDYVEYRHLLQRYQLAPEVVEALESILRPSGTEQVYERATRYTRDPVVLDALKHLRGILEVLKAYGVSDHVVVDLTLVGDFTYYTGMTFEGYASGLGFPVVSGGRYDNLLGQFGRPAPATGFAVKTNRILEIAGSRNQAYTRHLVLYDEAGRGAALAHAAGLRQAGQAAVVTQFIAAGETAEVCELGDGRKEYKGGVYDKLVWFSGSGNGQESRQGGSV